MFRPKVTVIIVNWNGWHHLQTCLPAVIASSYPNYDIIVVDNGSTDCSLEKINEQFPQVTTLALGENLGFTGANNQAMLAALGNGAVYIALLNNDTAIEPIYLESLVTHAESDPTIGICSAQQICWDGERTLQQRFVPEWAEIESEWIDLSPTISPAPSCVPVASGAAMLIRSSALISTGLFDNRYFMYVEDVDLSLRMWLAGYKVVHAPVARVRHRIGGSNLQNPTRINLGYRNQLTTIFKLYEPSTLMRYRRAILKRWFLTPNLYALRATLASLQQLPTTLALRQQLVQRRKQPDNVFLSLIKP